MRNEAAKSTPEILLANAAVDERAERTSLGALNTERGFAAVALDEAEHLTEYRPDGSTARLA